ncbi:MAG: hypothetical protein HRU20_22670 [Pseudomonadales bacterium]|nr:hypothetical protein [Pseudomonadales bacterium]
MVAIQCEELDLSLLTGDIDNEILQKSLESGAVQSYIPKSWNRQALTQDVVNALSIRQQLRQISDLTQIINSCNNAMLMLSDDAVVISCNHAFTEITHVYQARIIGNKIQDMVEGMEIWGGIKRLCRINKRWHGSGKCMRNKQCPLRVSFMLCHIHDTDEGDMFCLWFSDQSESEKSVFQRFYHPITQLPGLALFKKTFIPPNAISALQSSSVLLIYLNVNYLDYVKSSFGSVVADILLKNISHECR